MKTLTDLYRILSKSNNEKNLSNYVSRFLTKHQIPHNITYDYQIYNLQPGKPLVCAHMDQVGTKQISNIYTIDNYISGNCNIGADDKNGVFIVMYLLLEFRDKLSFIFSTGEEVGCNIMEVLKEVDEKVLDEIPYGLIFDRQNGGDIIGYSNNYCNLDLDKDIENIGKNYGFKSTFGLISDCDIIAGYGIPSVNLSCGYYKPHTNYEFTDLFELKNAYDFGKEILNTLTETYSRVEYKPTAWYYDDEYFGYSSKRTPYTTKSYNTDKFKKKLGDITKSVLPDNTDLYKCFLCDFVFSIHDMPTTPVCPICKGKINAIKKSSTNEQSNTGYDKILYCLHCKNFFPVDLNMDESFLCPYCYEPLYIDYFFLIASNYLFHEETYGMTTYCPKCHRMEKVTDTNSVGTCKNCQTILYVDSVDIAYEILEKIIFDEIEKIEEYTCTSNSDMSNYYCTYCDRYYQLSKYETWPECPRCQTMLIEDIDVYNYS